MRMDHQAIMALVQQPAALAATAFALRRERFGLGATFIHNHQVNPTNVCVNICPICRFAVRPGSGKGYLLDRETILAQVAAENPREVHIVGGLSPDFTLEDAVGLVAALRRHFPGLFIKAFTAVEIDWFARRAEVTVEAALAHLLAAGLDALPGGGAEIFDPALRRRHFPDKISGDAWLAIHRAAHRLGMTSNATLLFGLGEGWPKRIDHLQRLAELQGESGGFSAFIALPAQRPAREGRVSPLVCLQVIALARILLAEVPHIKAYWPMLGLATAAMALGWGADDLEGTLGREQVAHAAGAETPTGMSVAALCDYIRRAGYVPVERDGRFAPVDP